MSCPQSNLFLNVFKKVCSGISTIFILKGVNNEEKLDKVKNFEELLDRKYSDPYIKSFQYDDTSLSCTDDIFNMVDDYKDDTHDFDFKVKNAQKFLEDGNKVKITDDDDISFGELAAKQIHHQEGGHGVGCTSDHAGQ